MISWLILHFCFQVLMVPTPVLSIFFIFFADFQLRCGCYPSLMLGIVPRCHGNNHFKKTIQCNKISNNESLGSLYRSQEGKTEPEIELRLANIN